MRSVRVERETLDRTVSDEFKTICVNIRFCGEDKKAILLTSCSRKDAKDAVSLQLAVSMAELGKKTLLLDADLREGSLGSRVSESGAGLTDYLNGKAELGEIQCASDVPGLFVVTTGPLPPNSIDLLSGERFRAALDAFRGDYDYVIVNASTLDVSVDAMVVASLCDGAVIVVKPDTVKRKDAREMKAKLVRSGCPILGAVMNGASAR